MQILVAPGVRVVLALSFELDDGKMVVVCPGMMPSAAGLGM